MRDNGSAEGSRERQGEKDLDKRVGIAWLALVAYEVALFLVFTALDTGMAPGLVMFPLWLLGGTAFVLVMRLAWKKSVGAMILLALLSFVAAFPVYLFIGRYICGWRGLLKPPD